MSRQEHDREMMTRCIALSKTSGRSGEYPYAALISRGDKVVAESTNRVRHEHDVTRHAEIVAISLAQHALASESLDDCAIYINAEPCAMCSFAIRECRIRRVVYGLSSPHMGGVSKWNVLGDADLSKAMPEVYAPPPEIVAGYMEAEVQQALIEWHPLIARIIEHRGLFGSAPRVHAAGLTAPPPHRHDNPLLRFLRRNFFDYFGRR
ncbi:MAG TPA: nucleoside deaminase [Pseudolabrys sp.]|nr:nucleoside deaminase [Pseudolabrys sp.]